jgi:hypothetical protein
VSTSVTFYGASDDLIEVEGDAPGCDEYNEDDASFLVVCDGDAGCIVHIGYTHNGTWQIGVQPIGENVPMPNATIGATGYSAHLTIPEVLHVTRRAADA